ncbi:sigma-70 family RNA polymerase sigma factor [soil metagenome]
MTLGECRKLPVPATDLVPLIPALRAFARSLCRDLPDADDLVQETLLKGLAHIDQFEPGTSLKAWLFRILRNTYFSARHRRAREVPTLPEQLESQICIAPSQEWACESKDVLTAIRNLPVHQREAMVLVTISGLKYGEAADICGCSIGTIKSRISRARSNLIRELELTPHDAGLNLRQIKGEAEHAY